MPGRDGMGPVGPGRNLGRGSGRGRMGGDKAGAGPNGECVCTKCGTRAPHDAGMPCNVQECPRCGAKMTRA